MVLHGIPSLIVAPGMQRLLGEEGEHAVRLLTRHETDFPPILRMLLRLEA